MSGAAQSAQRQACAQVIRAGQSRRAECRAEAGPTPWPSQTPGAMEADRILALILSEVAPQKRPNMAGVVQGTPLDLEVSVSISGSV